MARAAASLLSGEREVITTVAPASASRAATCQPTPREPPAGGRACQALTPSHRRAATSRPQPARGTGGRGLRRKSYLCTTAPLVIVVNLHIRNLKPEVRHRTSFKRNKMP
eukprot:scaffold9456_cov59-Phaeocystis_antarctica.AAC.4